MQRIYFVLFDVEKNRTTYNFMINLMAENAKDAKDKARKLWVDKGNTSHQFHMYAHRSGIQIMHQLHIRDFAENDYHGCAAMDKFVCTDSRHWPSRH